jgi:uncharacterized protein YcbK (DUF882 family)
MIVMKELNPNNYPVDEIISKKLDALLIALNIVRKEYGKPMYVTSGLRSLEKHIEIYRLKGIIDLAKIPMNSAHLWGEAADIADKDGSLAEWVGQNVAVLEEAGLYCERCDYTHGWVHFQIREPLSKNRFFIP